MSVACPSSQRHYLTRLFYHPATALDSRLTFLWFILLPLCPRARSLHSVKWMCT